MKKRNKYLFKNVGILAISKFSSKLLIFLLIPLYTSVLSTKEYGIYDLIISTVQLIFPIITLNIVDAIMRYSMEKDVDKKECATIGLKYILLSFIIITFFLIINRIFLPIKQINGLEIFIFFYFVLYSLNEYFIQLSKGLDYVKTLGIAGVLGTIVTVICTVLFLKSFNFGLKGFIFANILGLLAQVLYYILKIKYWNLLNFKTHNKVLKKEMLLYSIPLIATAVGWWVNNAADKYAVSFICGLTATGLLSIAYKIPSIINVIQTIFMQAWQISAIKEYESDDSAIFYGKYFENINFLMCILCSLLILLSRPIAHLLYAKDFYNAWIYVPFLLISSTFNTASGFLGPILSAEKKSKEMAKSAIYGTIVNIILNIILIKLIGLQGATIATAISSFIIFCVRKKEIGKNIYIEKYYKILLSWLLLIVEALFEIFSSYYLIEIIIFIEIIVLNLEKRKCFIVNKKNY